MQGGGAFVGVRARACPADTAMSAAYCEGNVGRRKSPLVPGRTLRHVEMATVNPGRTALGQQMVGSSPAPWPPSPRPSSQQCGPLPSPKTNAKPGGSPVCETARWGTARAEGGTTRPFPSAFLLACHRHQERWHGGDRYFYIVLSHPALRFGGARRSHAQQHVGH